MTASALSVAKLVAVSYCEGDFPTGKTRGAPWSHGTVRTILGIWHSQPLPVLKVIESIGGPNSRLLLV